MSLPRLPKVTLIDNHGDRFVVDVVRRADGSFVVGVFALWIVDLATGVCAHSDESLPPARLTPNGLKRLRAMAAAT